jgi:esterase/lipase
MNVSQTKTIVFITGAFVTHDCWDEWKSYFEQKGYTCIVPAWPHKSAVAKTLRQNHPDRSIASNRLADLTNYYADIVNQQREKPIVIGHSMGGLIVQLLLQRNLVSAGIAIHSAAPKGIISTKFSFLKSVIGPLGFFTSKHEPFMMSFKQWQYAFTNGMRVEEQKAGYEKFCTPESKQVMRDALTNAAKINFKKPHEPLLFISGSADHIIPASLNKSNFKKYKDQSSVTDYKEFEGRNHFTLGQDNWQAVASFIYEWLIKH